MRRALRGAAGALTLLAATAAGAQTPGGPGAPGSSAGATPPAGDAAGQSPASSGRPSEEELFGGGPTPVPGAPASQAPPAAAGAKQTEAAPAGTARDQAILGSDTEAKFLSGFVAPENPLQIGGQLYLRAQTTASSGQTPDQWAFSAPSLLDVYLDARPNPRVRAFVLERMSYDPTLAPDTSTTTGMTQVAAGGAVVGDTNSGITGFSTFSNTRGPNTLLDQMWIRFDILQRVFVTAGKQHVHWGTGRFWQPTDYLHPVKRNPLDVFDIRAGETMLKLDIPWEEQGWNFYAIGVTEDPDGLTNTLGKIAGAARVEGVIAGVEVGADVYLHKGENPRYGFDFSTGLWDFDVYGDLAVRPGGDFFHYDPELNEVGTFTGYETQAVGGLNYSRKYNDNDMWTAGVEYFYNHPGYTSASTYTKALEFAVQNPTQLPNGNPFSLFPFFYLGRQYGAVFVSFPAPYSWNYTTFTLSTLGNLSDKSFISRLDYSVTVLTHLSVEAFAGVHYGHVGGEFRFELPSDVAAKLGATGSTLTSYPVVDLGAALRIKM
jgi:hypothetical protein